MQGGFRRDAMMDSARHRKDFVRNVRQGARIVLRRRKIVLAVMLLVGLYVIGEHYLVGPMYRTSLKLRVEAAPPPVAGLEQNLTTIFDPTFMPRQVAVLQSSTVLRDVVKSLKLGHRWGVADEAAANMLARKIY